MLPCHIYYINGTWRSKEVGDLKSSLGGRGSSHKGEIFMGEGVKTPQGPQLVCLNYLPI